MGIQQYFLTVLLLLCSANAIKWQGIGNMSESNLTTIWTYINANFIYGTFQSGRTDKIVGKISDFSSYLNGIWDPAWNVVLIYTFYGQNQDSVVYGYAFRDHWLWYNGFTAATGL